METLVLYKGHSGFTERIARYIGRQLQCDVKPFKAVNTVILMNYELIIFGAPIENGELTCMRDLIVKKNEINNQLVVFATGSKPASLADIDAIKAQIPEKYQKNFAYFQTGINYEKTGFLRINKLKKFIESEKEKPAINEEHKAYQQQLEKTFECINKEEVDKFIETIKSIPDPFNIF